MKFLDDDLLLESELAKQIYNDYAKDMPVIDYHCHIVPGQIKDNISFRNITQLWLAGDHYKWRLMRNCGIAEKYITGGAEDFEKFEKFCECMPRLIGNPIYIWCHLELKTYFGIEKELCPENAEEIFKITEKLLKTSDFSAKSIIKRSRVEVICTTDDPIDCLSTHEALALEDNGFKVLPTFRPDKALNIELGGFSEYLQKLSIASEIKTDSLQGIKDALLNRLLFFKKRGCKITDHALSAFTYESCDDAEAEAILKSALNGGVISALQAEKYRTNILVFLGKAYAENNMVMQLHFSCLRNNNTLMFNKLGPDTGFDAINRSGEPYKLSAFLNTLYACGKLPKTIIYSLDNNDNMAINSIIGCFQGLSRGHLQHGSAWWFNDTELGMKTQLKTLCEYGVLGNFIGMLTDSRSFTSYVRHDYFRRILCSVIAQQVNEGKYPNNPARLKELVQSVCYYNIKNYL